jgi:hypothetical protein
MGRLRSLALAAEARGLIEADSVTLLDRGLKNRCLAGNWRDFENIGRDL